VLKKRLYTFIVASNADARLWRLSLPYSVLIAVGFFTGLGVISAGIATYHYCEMLVRVASYDRILTENDSFRAENQQYRIQTAQLGGKIDYLESLASRLTIYAGMEAERSVGGVGGYSRYSFSQPLSPSAGDIPSIDKYNRDIVALENRYRGLEADLSMQALVKSVTPSMLPVRGYMTDGHGMRPDPFNRSARDYHTGVDISAPHGTRVVAPADGTVVFAGYRAGYGNVIVIDHKFGVITRFGHLSKYNVQPGQRISRSDVIGYVGSTGRSTGPHLHFEIWVHNKPVNPAKYLAGTRRG